MGAISKYNHYCDIYSDLHTILICLRKISGKTNRSLIQIFMKTVTQGCFFTIQKLNSEIKNKKFFKIKIGKCMKGLV